MTRFEETDAVTDDGQAPGLPELAELLEERDAELNAHGARVAAHAERIAREMGLPSPVVGRVRIAARLHDLGKVWIARDILDKPGPLNEKEWSEMRRHPSVAARLLKTWPPSSWPTTSGRTRAATRRGFRQATRRSKRR
jgi:HD-GYP domain-containing protein (c-di-GMP phosphodiesterase class II)